MHHVVLEFDASHRLPLLLAMLFFLWTPNLFSKQIRESASCIPSWFGGLSLVFPWQSFRAPYSCFTHFIAISCLFWLHLLIFSPWSSSFAQPSNAGVSQGWDFDFLFCFFCTNYTGKTLLTQNSNHHLCAYDSPAHFSILAFPSELQTHYSKCPGTFLPGWPIGLTVYHNDVKN